MGLLSWQTYMGVFLANIWVPGKQTRRAENTQIRVPNMDVGTRICVFSSSPITVPEFLILRHDHALVLRRLVHRACRAADRGAAGEEEEAGG